LGHRSHAATPGPLNVLEWNVATRTLRSINGRQGSGERRRLNATGTEMSSTRGEVLEIRDDDATSAKLETHLGEEYRRDDWNARVEAALRMRLTKTDFQLTGEIKAFDDGKLIFSKVWDRKIPREFI
jgi:uncharacterized protein